ncbi:MAG: Rrf2 family transcriptional regulator [Chloroflexi bacterium]|nr:Rrf2 family transcriptional regulator [Chloroflexota bacterium]
MQLTTKSRYVIRAMIDLAIFSGNGPVLVKDIAQRQKMSARYLEQLLLAPKAAGMIRSMRGAHGGFTLTRAPSEITLREIVQIMEGSISPTECADDPGICPSSGSCVTHDIWVRIKKATDEILESTTLQDLVDRQHEKGSFRVDCVSDDTTK